ncbi:DUF6415 family natural product biosynthesis protein [Streptomyces sp. NPDC005385]|uniref:DUF6415 family natural product biosynthesis protein n=1 Tax=Streptomyces sp. NPDC005385 TaxID=3157039 RepID=UPI0033AA0F3C
MTAPGAVAGPERVVDPWEPPLDVEALTSVLAACRAWSPLDGETILDDVGAVLDDVVPPEEALDEHALRLRGHLMQLIAIATAAEAGQKDTDAARLIERGRQVRAEELPGDHRQSVGHLRRMAWVVNELHERLGEIACIRETV